MLDFLLSLTPKAKAKLTDSTNKSVLYNYILSDEDVCHATNCAQIESVLISFTQAKWATQTKASIASYLQQGIEGKFYYRMVDTVLTRDKNWVRWKAEACPPIERAPLSIQDHLDTQASAIKISTNRKLRSQPLGSLDLSFLKEDTGLDRMNRLQTPDRFEIPAVDSYMRGIADDEFNAEMAQSQEEKDEATRAKASKTWRTLRLASRNKLNLLDKIDDGNNLKILFAAPSEEGGKSHAETENTINGSQSAPKPASKENLATTDGTVAEQS